MKVQTLLHAFLTPKRASLQGDELQFLAGATQSSIEVAGQMLPAWSWGSGPRVLLVHGWDSRGVHLRPFVPALLARGFSVTLHDAPAHGAAPGQMTSVVHMGMALLRVARDIGDVQAVIGHSAGSAAALWAFRQGLHVSHSVHLAGPSTLEHLMLAASRKASLGEDEYQAFRSAASDFMGCPVEDMSVDRLTSFLAHRGLILHDPEDPFIPFSESQDLHDRWPTSTLKAVSGVGHKRIVSERSIVDECVRFLGERA